MTRPSVEGMQYGRGTGENRFYWYCTACNAYDYHERLSFVQLAGVAHMKVNHA
jgi:hypothetical protein